MITKLRVILTIFIFLIINYNTFAQKSTCTLIYTDDSAKNDDVINLSCMKQCMPYCNKGIITYKKCMGSNFPISTGLGYYIITCMCICG